MSVAALVVLRDCSMVQLSGKDWSGNLLFNVTTVASGRVNGYSWYFQSKSNSWMVEIAEEQAIEPNDLPLVGFGCGGWLYECDDSDLPNLNNSNNNNKSEADFINYVSKKLSLVFTMFHQNDLEYLPAVTCCCD